MSCTVVARKRKHLSLEEKLIGGVEEALDDIGIKSFSSYVESVLAAHLISIGKLPANYRLPGETRGGDQYSQKKDEDAK